MNNRGLHTEEPGGGLSRTSLHDAVARAVALHRLDTQLLAPGSSPGHNKKGNIHAR